jgi:cyclic pyranopterin phosphate synthase
MIKNVETPLPFNHFDAQGQAVMVDICAKNPTLRLAVAGCQVRMQPETLQAVLDRNLAKGDVLGVARLAGISAAKRTDELIPLSHPLALHFLAIDFHATPETGVLEIRGTVKAFERTGVEMEAMVATTVAALTVYDMCKGADKRITIDNVALLYKEGGKSGVFRREEGL